MTEVEIVSTADFLEEFASAMFGSGVHTSRVVRCTKRIGNALGVSVSLTTSLKTMVMSVSPLEHAGNAAIFHETRVVDVPSLPISFEWNRALSELSWRAVDENLSLEETKEAFRKVVAAPRISPVFVLVMASLANASFCRLFGGNVWAMLIVFTSTLLGFAIKQYLLSHKTNVYLTFVVCAFVSSVCASAATSLGIESAEIALATSVLWLVPGVPLINGIIDIADGHVQNGFTRLVSSALLIISMAIGLSASIILVKDQLL